MAAFAPVELIQRGSTFGFVIDVGQRLQCLPYPKGAHRAVCTSAARKIRVEQGNSGIRVNAVAPSPTDTAMLDRFTGTAEVNDAFVGTVPLRRRGTTEELANAIVFISSPEASYISGTVFEVDGVMSAT
jgi:NAD(P)-dependent dehydrogenase (short-subunit alcohol dehydrogenase family)